MGPSGIALPTDRNHHRQRRRHLQPAIRARRRTVSGPFERPPPGRSRFAAVPRSSFRSVEVTGGADSGTVAYIGRVNRAGTIARYERLREGLWLGSRRGADQRCGPHRRRRRRAGRRHPGRPDHRRRHRRIGFSTPSSPDPRRMSSMSRAAPSFPAFVDAHSHVWEAELMEPDAGRAPRIMLFRNGVTTDRRTHRSSRATVADLQRWDAAGSRRI